MNEICNNLVILPSQLYNKWFSSWRFCVYVFLSCRKSITFQQSPSNFIAIMTGLVYSSLYLRFEVIFLYVCIFMHMCMYTCICIYVYVSAFICAYIICACVSVYVYIYMYIYIYVCMFVYACMLVCIYVYVCI